MSLSAVVRAALLLLAVGALVALRPGPSRAATTTVPIGPSGSAYGPFWYCDSAHSGIVCTTTITVGDTVTWQNNTLIYHTSTECDSVCGTTPGSPLWDSGLIAPGGTFSRQFNQVGTFNYQCNVHPTQMKGQIIVQAGGPTATATLTSTALPPTPTFTPVPAVGGISIDPGVSAGSPASAHSASSSPNFFLEAIAGATAAALTLAGAFWCGRRLAFRRSP